jgi:hypothetical protein
MNPQLQAIIISELDRLETASYIGLLGTKYLFSEVTAPDDQGNRVRAINLAPAKGWAIVVWGPPEGELKHKFFRDLNGMWHYDGIEKLEAVH